MLPAGAAAGFRHARAALAVFGVAGTADFCRDLFKARDERLVGFGFFDVVKLPFEKLDLSLHLEGFYLHVGDVLPHGDLVWFWYLDRSGCWALLGQTADEKAEYTKESHRVGSGGMAGIFSVVERVRGGNADVVWPRAREAGISIFRRAAKFGYPRSIDG